MGLAARSSPGAAPRGAPPKASPLCRQRCLFAPRLPRLCIRPIRPLLWPPDAHRRYGDASCTSGLPPCPAGDARSLVRVHRRGQAPATSVALHLQGLPNSFLLSSRLHPTRAPPYCAVRQPLLKPALRRLAAAQPAVPPRPAAPQGQPQRAAPQSRPSGSQALQACSRANARRHLAKIMLGMTASGIIMQAPLTYWGCVCFFLCWGLLLVM